MGKNAIIRDPKEARAVLSSLRTSPIKLNQVAKMIRGMSVEKALTQLTFCQRRIAVDVRKVLLSAIANAENNHNLNVDDLVVKEAFVGKSMVLKRMSPRARGRGARIEKPYSHLTIVVREEESF
jgi:large subunit ribosomal protein L22